MGKKLISLLIANLFAVSPAVLAQDMAVTGSVGLGGIATDDDDSRNPYKLYEYRDLDDGVLATFDIRGRGSRYWFDLFGENLGRDDQYLMASYRPGRGAAPRIDDGLPSGVMIAMPAR